MVYVRAERTDAIGCRHHADVPRVNLPGALGSRESDDIGAKRRELVLARPRVQARHH